jgi:hypothetical protein
VDLLALDGRVDPAVDLQTEKLPAIERLNRWPRDRASPTVSTLRTRCGTAAWVCGADLAAKQKDSGDFLSCSL